MQKIYIVRLSEDERTTCLALVKKLKGSSQKVRNPPVRTTMQRTPNQMYYTVRH